MNYSKFTLTRVWKNKFNIIPFILVAMLVIFMYYIDYSSAYGIMQNPQTSGEKNAEHLKEDMLRFEKEMTKYDESSKEYQMAKIDYNMAENRFTLTKQKLEAYRSGNWNEYYKNGLELTKITSHIIENDTAQYNEEFANVLSTYIQYDQYMIDYNLQYDTHFHYIQGVSRMIKVINYNLPILLTIMLIYILSSMYCSTYIDNLDMQKLIPLSSIKKQASKLFSGCIVGVSIVLFISVLAILCGTIGNTFGSFLSPVQTYHVDGSSTFLPFLSYLPQLLFLLMLSILFIVNLVSVISIFVRKNMICLLISAIVLIGGVEIITNISSLYSYLHLLPTTYINTCKIITGELSYMLNNADVNFVNGVIVLSVSNVVLFLLYAYIQRILNRKARKV